MRPNDYFLSEIPDPLTYPYDLWEYIEVLPAGTPIEVDQQHFRLTYDTPFRYIFWKKHRIAHTYLDWQLQTIYWKDRAGNLHHLDAEDIYSEEISRFARGLASGFDTRPTHPAELGIEAGEIWGVRICALFSAVRKTHTIVGWADARELLYLTHTRR